MGVLAGGVEGTFIGAGVVGADCGAGLDRVGDQSVVDDVDFGNVGGLGKGFVRRRLIAQGPVENQVAGHIGMDLRAAIRQRGNGGGNGGGQVVVDRDQIGRSFRLIGGLGDDDGDLIANVSHGVCGQHRMGWRLHRLAVFVGHGPAANQTAEAVGGHVGAGEHGDHAGRCRGFAGIDGFDRGVSVRRAHERGIVLTGQGHVIDITPITGEKAIVLLTADGGADTRIGHGGFPPSTRRASLRWTRQPRSI